VCATGWGTHEQGRASIIIRQEISLSFALIVKIKCLNTKYYNG